MEAMKKKAWDHFDKAWDHFRMWCTTDSLEHLAKARHHAVRSNAIAPNRTMQSVIRWADREAKNPYDPGVS